MAVRTVGSYTLPNHAHTASGDGGALSEATKFKAGRLITWLLGM